MNSSCRPSFFFSNLPCFLRDVQGLLCKFIHSRCVESGRHCGLLRVLWHHPHASPASSPPTSSPAMGATSPALATGPAASLPASGHGGGTVDAPAPVASPAALGHGGGPARAPALDIVTIALSQPLCHYGGPASATAPTTSHAPAPPTL